MMKTKEADRFGNVSYRISDNGQAVGIIHKLSSGYEAETIIGSHSPRLSSIKAGLEWLERTAK
jgi:hypothetical protein